MTADITASLTRFANTDIRSAQRNGSLLVCNTKCGHIDLVKSAKRGRILVNGSEMRTADARAFLVENYVVEIVD